jgi:membrane associated rhomboid family serine protease
MPGFSFGKPKCVWCLRHEAAQRGEVLDDIPQPVMPTPWERTATAGGWATFTHALVAINVMVFIAMGASGMSLSNPDPRQLVGWGANFGPLTLSGEWWRLITYNFLHGGFLHIAFNMWCLWDLGALAESLYGTWTFGALYMICGVAGGLMSVGWNPVNLSVGASGAIFGLAGALIAGYYLGEFSIPRPLIQLQLRSLLIFVGYNVVFGLFTGYTDNAAHFGGLLAGLLCGALIARFAPSPQDVFSRMAILGLAVLILAGTTVALERSRGPMFQRMGLVSQDHQEVAELHGGTPIGTNRSTQVGFVSGSASEARSFRIPGEANQSSGGKAAIVQISPKYRGRSFARRGGAQDDNSWRETEPLRLLKRFS